MKAQYVCSLILSISLSLVKALPSQRARAVYFMDNHDQNSIYAIRVNPDGTLANDTRITSTGGLGASAIAGGDNPPDFAGPDSIVGTGSVRVYGQWLFAVNSWSNSLSMFQINPSNPLQLTLIGPPIDTQGDFPNSVIVSTRLGLACVTNGGENSNIACFRVSAQGLSPLLPVHSFPLNQTNPPVAFNDGPLNPQERAVFTSTQFNIDSSALLVTQAGNPTAGIAGRILVFPIDKKTRTLGAPIVSEPNGTSTLFNTLNIPNTNRVFLTDAFVGTAILEISPSTGVATTVSFAAVPGQIAICWSFQSKATGSVYSTDAVVNRLVEQDLNTGAVLGVVNGTNAAALGMVDLYGSQDKLYALSLGLSPGSTAVTVFDVSAGRGKAKLIQNFYPPGLTAVQTRGNFASPKGMAVYPNDD